MARASINLPAPAKLNLFLHVLGRRDDGYHTLQTYFQLIDFCDSLTLTQRDDSDVTLSPALEGVAFEDNLIVKAARALQQRCACVLGVDITLAKQLPMGGGIGGGSSDAATTLLGLNRLWNLGLSIDALAQLGATLGADVPVFVRGHSAWGEGIGDALVPMALPEAWYLLLMPDVQISTARLFVDPRLQRNSAPLDRVQYQPMVGHNDFEAVVRMDYPAVSKALDWLNQYATARLSGTGGVVFARFDTKAEAGRIAAKVPMGLGKVIAKSLNQSPVHLQLTNV